MCTLIQSIYIYIYISTWKLEHKLYETNLVAIHGSRVSVMEQFMEAEKIIPRFLFNTIAKLIRDKNTTETFIGMLQQRLYELFRWQL